MNSCLTVLQALAANQSWLQVGQFLGWQYGLTERCVEATCYATAFSWLITECHLDTMDHQRTAGAVHSTAVLSVELFERLHQQNVAFSFHLRNNARTAGYWTHLTYTRICIMWQNSPIQFTSLWSFSSPIKLHDLSRQLKLCLRTTQHYQYRHKHIISNLYAYMHTTFMTGIFLIALWYMHSYSTAVTDEWNHYSWSGWTNIPQPRTHLIPNHFQTFPCRPVWWPSCPLSLLSAYNRCTQSG